AATTSGATGERRPLEHRGHSTGDVGKVERVPAGFAIRPLDRFLATRHPLPKRRGWLVRQAVVVLDEVDPGESESVGALRELRRGYAERLERGTEQRAPGCAGELPHARDALARPAERSEQLERPFDACHDDARLQRDVAEQQVEE